MATKHGRNAVLYWGQNTAVPVAETHDDITANLEPDYAEDTAHGDNFKTRIPGALDFQLQFRSWFDTAYHTLMDDAIAKTVGRWYWYPDRTDSTIYWYGTGYLGMTEYATPMAGIVDTGFTVTPATQPTYKHP